jgi:hypothetical protein
MAARGCNFCGKVGSQPISNDRTTFNYDCLEVKNKKSNKNENQKKTANALLYFEFFGDEPTI